MGGDTGSYIIEVGEVSGGTDFGVLGRGLMRGMRGRRGETKMPSQLEIKGREGAG